MPKNRLFLIKTYKLIISLINNKYTREQLAIVYYYVQMRLRYVFAKLKINDSTSCSRTIVAIKYVVSYAGNCFFSNSAN